MTILASTKIGDLATRHPMTTQVFSRHGIDFCCGGGKPLEDVCVTKGLDAQKILNELEAVIAQEGQTETSDIRWDKEPLPALIDHILVTYHEPLYEELPRIEAMMRKVHRVHGDKDQALFDALLETVLAIKAEIEQHLPKEEQILFPMIKSGRGSMAGGPMQVMEMEHDTLGRLLEKTRELTDGYVPPEMACNTWRALWAALENLETETHKHLHLENNVLHPRVRLGE